ncbi:hypothetical protein ZIOFF_045524 [Zingiber officinale]|uniref:Uncharacterized protein n=1 Tax=Zingiber officinale TaxID=94328 RepID=A0A8J5L156_ZINOF|nr:hypothetical protein ZIOFF_045524 [Zingiber officinale]
MATPKCVINPKESGEEAGQRTDPFRWMIDGFSTIANREEDGEKYVGFYLLNDDADSKISEIKAIYKLFIFDQLHAEHIQKEGEDSSPKREKVENSKAEKKRELAKREMRRGGQDAGVLDEEEDDFLEDVAARASGHRLIERGAEREEQEEESRRNQAGM